MWPRGEDPAKPGAAPGVPWFVLPESQLCSPTLPLPFASYCLALEGAACTPALGIHPVVPGQSLTSVCLCALLRGPAPLGFCVAACSPDRRLPVSQQTEALGARRQPGCTREPQAQAGLGAINHPPPTAGKQPGGLASAGPHPSGPRRQMLGEAGWEALQEGEAEQQIPGLRVASHTWAQPNRGHSRPRSRLAP